MVHLKVGKGQGVYLVHVVYRETSLTTQQPTLAIARKAAKDWLLGGAIAASIYRQTEVFRKD